MTSDIRTQFKGKDNKVFSDKQHLNKCRDQLTGTDLGGGVMYVYTPPWGGGESIIHKNQQNLAQCKVTKSMSPMGCLSPPSPLEWGDNSGTVYT